jgi:hypothetical protein
VVKAVLYLKKKGVMTNAETNHDIEVGLCLVEHERLSDRTTHRFEISDIDFLFVL